MMEKKDLLQREKQILDLPLDCIAKIIGSTNPKYACRISTTSKIFKSIIDSDNVWQHFLPFDYNQIISRSANTKIFNDNSKKQTFLHLSDSNGGLLIDGGALHFSVDRRTGKKRFVMGARSLYIEWSETPEFWAWRAESGSRFEEAAVLQWVWWLEIRGKIRMRDLTAGTRYGAYLIFKMGGDKYGFIAAADVSVEVTGEMKMSRRVYLDPNEEEREEEDGGELPEERDDGWLEIEMGEFFIEEEGDEDKEVQFLLIETRGLSSKGGLIVEGYEARPK